MCIDFFVTIIYNPPPPPPPSTPPQRLRCFSACCKGQIIIHTSEIDGSEPELEVQDDKKYLWPSSCLALPFTLCGPTGCGKTKWIVELLKHHEELCTRTPKNWFGFMALNNQTYLKPFGNCEFIDGFPEDVLTRLEQASDRGSLCIFDDVMNEVNSNSIISKLFTHGRSHHGLGCSLVLMLQNILPKGTQSGTISINAQHQVFFCNPRDSLQISILTRQLCPRNIKHFFKIYKRAMQRPYGYLFCCFTQSCPDEIRYRTNVLPNEYPSIVYQL